MPNLAFGIPVYNGRPYLEAAIDSVRAQTLAPDLVIIGDNGSNDGTREDIERWSTSPDLVPILHPRNLGIVGNMNAVLDRSDTRYFAWLAADDRLDPRYAEACCAELDVSDAVLVVTESRKIDAAGRHVGDFRGLLDHRALGSSDPVERFRTVLRTPPALLVFGVFRRHVLAELGGHHDGIGGDRVTLGAAALAGPIHVVDATFFDRRDHGGTYSRRHKGIRERVRAMNGRATPAGAVKALYVDRHRAHARTIDTADLPAHTKKRAHTTLSVELPKLIGRAEAALLAQRVLGR